MLMLAGIAVGWSINAMMGRDFENLCIAVGLWLVVGILLWIVDRRNNSRRKKEKIEQRDELRKAISTAVADGLMYAIRMGALNVPQTSAESGPTGGEAEAETEAE